MYEITINRIIIKIIQKQEHEEPIKNYITVYYRV